MTFPANMWVLLAVSAVMCAVGFYKFVYFLSIGYGFAVMGEGIAICILLLTGSLTGTWSIPLIIQCVLFVIYGIRLSGFLLIRELKSGSYRKVFKEVAGEGEKPMPVFVKAAIWICVSFLYVAQVSPVFYRANVVNSAGGDVLSWIGVIVSAAGIILEAAADKQKSAQKKINPNMVAMDGLYKMCRCPNYFGEIVFWTGVIISALNILTGWQWLIAVIGYVCIVYIMFNGAQRLEKRQNKNYGSKKQYREYTDKTPIIIPLIPLYHLVKEEKK